MISKSLINKIEKFAFAQYDLYHAPSRFHVELGVEKGQWLANEFNADNNVVKLGTLLMDCMLGKAYKEGKLSDHIIWSRDIAKELLSKDTQISKSEKAEIIACIEQHHGVNKFHSLEAEICCNADCYKFISVRGVIGGIANSREMPLNDLVNLYLEKAEEKWNALTLNVCKRELELQYQLIIQFLNNYKK